VAAAGTAQGVSLAYGYSTGLITVLAEGVTAGAATVAGIGQARYAGVGTALGEAIASGTTAWFFAGAGTSDGAATGSGASASTNAAQGLAGGTTKVLGRSPITGTLLPTWIADVQVWAAFIEGERIASVHLNNEQLWP